MAFGLLGLWLETQPRRRNASAMEAGYFPRLVCALLSVAFGAALAAMSTSFRPEKFRRHRSGAAWFSCLCRAYAFALLLHPLGFVQTMLVSILLACLRR